MAEYGLGKGKVTVPNSPFAAEVNVEIIPEKYDAGADGGNEVQPINLSSADDNYVVTFSTTVGTETGGTDSFEYDTTIGILDPTGTLIESIIGRLYEDTLVRYSYGYGGGSMSAQFDSKLVSYTSVLTPQGTRVDITLVTVTAEAQSHAAKNSKGVYYGSPSEIVREIAAEEGWELGQIENTKKLYEKTRVNVTSIERDQQTKKIQDDLMSQTKDPLGWILEQQKDKKPPGPINVDDLIKPPLNKPN